MPNFPSHAASSSALAPSGASTPVDAAPPAAQALGTSPDPHIVVDAAAQQAQAAVVRVQQLVQANIQQYESTMARNMQNTERLLAQASRVAEQSLRQAAQGLGAAAVAAQPGNANPDQRVAEASQGDVDQSMAAAEAAIQHSDRSVQATHASASAADAPINGIVLSGVRDTSAKLKAWSPSCWSAISHWLGGCWHSCVENRKGFIRWAPAHWPLSPFILLRQAWAICCG